MFDDELEDERMEWYADRGIVPAKSHAAQKRREDNARAALHRLARIAQSWLPMPAEGCAHTVTIPLEEVFADVAADYRLPRNAVACERCSGILKAEDVAIVLPADGRGGIILRGIR